MILLESNERAINLYNKLTNTQDGKEFISYLSRIGIPNTFFEWAIKCIVTEEIPNYILKDTYNMWKHYAVSYLSDNNITTVNLNDITHVTALEIINKAVDYYKNLNEIFNDGKTTIMAIKTFHHANLLPPDLKKWCICISNKRFEEFFPDSGAFLLIKNPSLKHPYQNVIAIVSKDCVEYWDETNQRMSYYSYEQEKRLVEYEQMLSDEAVQKINHFKITENKEYKTNTNMKQRIVLKESDLHRMIKESVKKVLKENKNDMEEFEDIWDLEGDSHKSFKNKYGFTDHSDIPSQFYQFKDIDEPNSYHSGDNVPYSHRNIGDVDKEKEASWKDFDYVKSQLNKARNRYLDKEYEKRTSYTRPRAENEFLPSELDDYLNSYRSPNNYTNTPNLKGYADDFKDELDKKWKSQQERAKYEKMADSRPLHRKSSLNREL